MAARSTPPKSPRPAATAAKHRTTTPRRPAAKPRPKAARSSAPTILLTLAGLFAAGAAAIGGALFLRRRTSEGTEPTDLLGDARPDGSERAIEAFRPDPTAPVPASEREQFRPALAGVAANANDLSFATFPERSEKNNQFGTFTAE